MICLIHMKNVFVCICMCVHMVLLDTRWWSQMMGKKGEAYIKGIGAPQFEDMVLYVIEEKGEEEEAM